MPTSVNAKPFVHHMRLGCFKFANIAITEVIKISSNALSNARNSLEFFQDRGPFHAASMPYLEKFATVLVEHPNRIVEVRSERNPEDVWYQKPSCNFRNFTESNNGGENSDPENDNLDKRQIRPVKSEEYD